MCSKHAPFNVLARYLVIQIPALYVDNQQPTSSLKAFWAGAWVAKSTAMDSVGLSWNLAVHTMGVPIMGGHHS